MKTLVEWMRGARRGQTPRFERHRDFVAASGVFSVAALAHAQDSLPFPPKESGSTARPTMQSSVYEPLPAVKRLPNGTLSYEYNLFEIQRTRSDAQRALPAGKVEIESRVAQGRRAGPLDVVVCGRRRSHPLRSVGRRDA
ncbi:hypothetical protein [Variovorax atrisoli]|uniref:hypothetical protein n=1 Tax=Variovorax atrisoli TaxID=3394203 RepID=UPI003391D06A